MIFRDATRTAQAISALHIHALKKVALRRSKGLQTVLDPEVSTLRKLAVLGEEHGEVCNLFNQSTAEEHPPDLDRLREELLDLSTAAMLWAETLREPPVE